MDIGIDNEFTEDEADVIKRVHDMISNLPNCRLEEFLASIKNHYVNTKLKIIMYILIKQREGLPPEGIGVRELVDELDIDTPMIKLVMDDLREEGVVTMVGDINPTQSIVENMEAIIGKIEWVD